MKKIIAGLVVLILVVGAVIIFIPKGNSDGTVSTEKNIRANKVCVQYKACKTCGCLKKKSGRCVKVKKCPAKSCGCVRYK